MAFIPDLITNELKSTTYKRGGYLGEGGFATCYELIDKNNAAFAGKVVAKSSLQNSKNMKQIQQEIAIHKSLMHSHIVKMHTFFEDKDNIYLILELCENQTLKELQIRRSQITEPEARYFMYQIIHAVAYLHENLVIHRDLKLDNIFLNSQMQIKIGDFGMATKLTHPDEKKSTGCGTPNYIAPEMLQKKLYSFEVDIWACGCILYSLICGQSPFKTYSFEETFCKIKKCDFVFPNAASCHACELITQLLHPIPAQRPCAVDILKFKFFVKNSTQKSLPKACLSNAPKLKTDTRRLIPDKKNSPQNAMKAAAGGGDRLMIPALTENKTSDKSCWSWLDK